MKSVLVSLFLVACLFTANANAQCSNGVCLMPQTGQPVRNTVRFVGRVGRAVLPPYEVVNRHFHYGGTFFNRPCNPVRRTLFGRPYVFPRRYNVYVGSFGPAVTYWSGNYGVVMR